jgi:thiamine monophosphate kinase
VPAARAPAFAGAAASLDFGVTRIGEITAGAGVTIERADGTAMDLGKPGWDHFA